MLFKYAWAHILEKPTYSEKDGSWKEVTPEEMVKFIGLPMYMGILELPRLNLYWSTTKLLSGLLPPKVMARQRFTALLATLHVSDPETNGERTVLVPGTLISLSEQFIAREVLELKLSFFHSYSTTLFSIFCISHNFSIIFYSEDISLLL